MSHLIIKKKNEVYITMVLEPHVYHELSDYFILMFQLKFMPQYRNKYWDERFDCLILERTNSMLV